MYKYSPYKRCYNNPVIEGRRCRNAVVKANWNSTWQEYENGFGEIPEELGKGDFWLGLKNMHEITRERRGTEARIELYSWGERSWAKYGTFLLVFRTLCRFIKYKQGFRIETSATS